jgi:hypothetical protein
MDLTTHDRQLMTEHDDLKLLRVCRSDQKRDQLQDPLEGDVKDGQDHDSPLRKGRYFMLIELTHPTGESRRISEEKWLLRLDSNQQPSG